MFLGVIRVSHLEEYKLRLEFNDSVIKDIDLKDELFGEVFKTLKDVNIFKQVKVNSEINIIE